MATNETHGTFEDLLRGTSPELRAVCVALRELIAALHPGRVEVVWPRQKIASYGFGPKKMTEHYAYIAVQRAHVNLGFYRGAALDDPNGLLEGTGKALRHCKVRTLAATQGAALRRLLCDAIAERKTPAREG
jgi:hypothetical protein